MIRVLQVVNSMDRAGLETILMNYYRAIDRTKIQFDFLTHRSESGAYDEEIRSLGGKIYKAPRLYPQNYKVYFKYMKEFFELHKEYYIIHAHIDTMATFPLLAAKKAGIPVRISQSHNTAIDRDFRFPIKKLCQYILPHLSTHYWGCSEEAVSFLYRKKIYKSGNYHIMKNAIDSIKFDFNETKRMEIREILGISENDIVLGHIGRFTKVKNQKFLIRIFEEILQIDLNVKLLFIGKGKEFENIRKLIHEKKIEDNIKLLGVRNDIAELMMAMDAFILPSLFEGLPVVTIEAQASGLPTFVSDVVTSEACVTSQFYKISLSKPPKGWAEIIMNKINLKKRKGNMDLIKKAGYDIHLEAENLTICYSHLNNKYR